MMPFPCKGGLMIKSSVLVVEDIAILRLAMILQLEELGISADAASDGIEAVQLAQKNDYILILTDIVMPKMDGLKATSAIRRFERSEGRRAAKIVAVTSGGASKESCIDAGMDAYYAKPITVQDVKKIVLDMAPDLL